MSAVTSWENAIWVIFKFSARPWNSSRSSFVRVANVVFGGVTKLLDLNSWISFKMLRNKCVKVVLRVQWLVTIEGSLVQCKTRFVQIFHIFFFMKHIFVDSPSKLVRRSHSVLRRGRSGYENTDVYEHGITTIARLPLSRLTHSLNYSYEYLLFCYN